MLPKIAFGWIALLILLMLIHDRIDVEAPVTEPPSETEGYRVFIV